MASAEDGQRLCLDQQLDASGDAGFPFDQAEAYERDDHLVNRLEEETRLGKAGALAAQLCRLDVIVLDELGYLPFARSGGQLLFHLISKLYGLLPVSRTPS